MIVDRIGSPPGLLLAGAVRGLPSEVSALREALDEFQPAAVAVTLSEEETETLRGHFVGTPAEPVVPLSGSETAHAVGLARLLDVQVPAPAHLAALEWGVTHARPVVGVDPSEEIYAELFSAHIGYLELVRRTLRERRLVKEPPAENSPEAYALAWERRMTPGAGSERLVRARDGFVVDRIQELRTRYRRLAVVADRERYESLHGLLGSSRE